jgi:ribosome-associated protein
LSPFEEDGITVEPASATRLEQARQRVLACAAVAADNKGRDVVVLDLRQLTPLVDYFIIATGTSRRQIHTIADEIERIMSARGERRIGIEGYGASRWVLLDYGDVVVHVFDDATRRYYDLENLWGDAPRVDLS